MVHHHCWQRNQYDTNVEEKTRKILSMFENIYSKFIVFMDALLGINVLFPYINSINLNFSVLLLYYVKSICLIGGWFFCGKIIGTIQAQINSSFSVAFELTLKVMYFCTKRKLNAAKNGKTQICVILYRFSSHNKSHFCVWEFSWHALTVILLIAPHSYKGN